MLHLAGGPKGDDVSTQNLVRASQRTGTVEHLVLISVIGADTVQVGYFVRKAKAHVLAAPSGVRWQPVASREVAARLAELTLGGPAGRVADLAGPRVYTLEELQRSYLTAVGKHPRTAPDRGAGQGRQGVPLGRQPHRGNAHRQRYLGAFPRRAHRRRQGAERPPIGMRASMRHARWRFPRILTIPAGT